jgi:hypothetical protein
VQSFDDGEISLRRPRKGSERFEKCSLTEMAVPHEIELGVSHMIPPMGF